MGFDGCCACQRLDTHVQDLAVYCRQSPSFMSIVGVSHVASRSPQDLQAFRISVGLLLLETPAADPLGSRGSAAGRRLPGLGRENLGSRTQPAHADFPLLYPGGYRGAGLLPREIRSRLQTDRNQDDRSEEHTSELQSLMRISYAVFCLKKKKKNKK